MSSMAWLGGTAVAAPFPGTQSSFHLLASPVHDTCDAEDLGGERKTVETGPY